MTAIQTYVLRCDNCHLEYRTDPPLRQAGQTRELAAADGWVHKIVIQPAGISPSQDFCPTCTPEAPPAPVPLPPVVLPRQVAKYVAAVMQSHVAREDLVHMDKARQALGLLRRGKS